MLRNILERLRGASGALASRGDDDLCASRTTRSGVRTPDGAAPTLARAAEAGLPRLLAAISEMAPHDPLGALLKILPAVLSGHTTAMARMRLAEALQTLPATPAQRKLRAQALRELAARAVDDSYTRQRIHACLLGSLDTVPRLAPPGLAESWKPPTGVPRNAPLALEWSSTRQPSISPDQALRPSVVARVPVESGERVSTPALVLLNHTHCASLLQLVNEDRENTEKFLPDWKHLTTPQDVADYFIQPPFLRLPTLAIMLGDTLAGYVFFSHGHRINEAAPCTKIRACFVGAAYRKKGLLKWALRELLRGPYGAPTEPVHFEVRVDNAPVQAFCKRLGLTRDSRSDLYDKYVLSQRPDPEALSDHDA